MKKIICYFEAILRFINHGVWCPHTYMEASREDAIIISTEDGFRVSRNYIHKPNETVHPKATLITNRCVCCGKKDLSWIDGEVPIISEIL